jgi:hypothetical protein
MDNPEPPAALGTQDTGRRQSRATGSIGHTRHRMKKNITIKKQHNTPQKTEKMSNTDIFYIGK